MKNEIKAIIIYAIVCLIMLVIIWLVASFSARSYGDRVCEITTRSKDCK